MTPPRKKSSPWRVLIASNHPLFGKGLRSLLVERWQEDIYVVGLVSSIDQAMQALEHHNPDLIIVDYDDQALDREAFLSRFMKTEHQLRVVLLSLQDGSAGHQATIYDRRTMEAARIEDWLDHGIPGRKDIKSEVGDNS